MSPVWPSYTVYDKLGAAAGNGADITSQIPYVMVNMIEYLVQIDLSREEHDRLQRKSQQNCILRGESINDYLKRHKKVQHAMIIAQYLNIAK